ncbi:hypothetical protein U1Q18_016426 [Sarracenia purpurea var. burkii]
MSRHKVHSHGAVPFSWEQKPGVSKVAHKDATAEMGCLKLPPPPCPSEIFRGTFHDLQVPLPPSGFRPPSRSSSRRGMKKEDDPFLTAYKECTKSTGKSKVGGDGKVLDLIHDVRNLGW